MKTTTQLSQNCFQRVSDFNSRSHADCDVESTRGKSIRQDFNSRSHMDCDRNIVCFLKHEKNMWRLKIFIKCKKASLESTRKMYFVGRERMH